MRRVHLPILILLAALLAAGCTPGGENGEKAEGEPPAGPPMAVSPIAGGMEPATYEGDLPCADCEGIHYTLNLFPDQTYFLRAKYQGKGDAAGFDEIGRWSRPDSTNRLALRSGQDTTMVFAVKTDAILRKLDAGGKEVESTLNYDLVRGDFHALEPHGTFSGMVRYAPDSASFEECSTGLSLDIAPEGDNESLQRAYAAVGTTPGDPLLAEVAGRIVSRPAPDGQGMRATLVVDTLKAVHPGEICGVPLVNADLRNTFWRLVRLGDRDVVSLDGRKLPWLRLTVDDMKMTGYTGCNTMGGTYELDGAHLRFNGVFMTRMACPGGVTYEPDFPRALEAVSHWEITGDHLELFDDLGTMLARFEAGPAPE